MTPYLPLFAEEACALTQVAASASLLPSPSAPVVSAPVAITLAPSSPMQAPSIDSSSRALQTLDQLARQIRAMETAGRPDRERISSGCPAIDQRLPSGGFARGSLVELIRNGPGTGVASIALMIARQAMDEGKLLVVMDTQRQFYPPAMKALGIPLERVIALRPDNHADAIWGLDQVLRCPAIGAVIVDAGHWDDRVSRRLQLACEQGGGLGILMRDVQVARSQPSWADVQWMVRTSTNPSHATAPLASQRDVRWFELELTRCSGGRTGARLTLGVDAVGQWIDPPTTQGTRYEHASALHLAAQLAQPTRNRRHIAG